MRALSRSYFKLEFKNLDPRLSPAVLLRDSAIRDPSPYHV